MKQKTQNGTHITITTHKLTITIHNLQNCTEAYKTYNHIYNDIEIETEDCV